MHSMEYSTSLYVLMSVGLSRTNGIRMPHNVRTVKSDSRGTTRGARAAEDSHRPQLTFILYDRKTFCDTRIIQNRTIYNIIN